MKVGNASIPVYCHMTSLGTCGEGGWTLVMKISGSQVYDSFIRHGLQYSQEQGVNRPWRIVLLTVAYYATSGARHLSNYAKIMPEFPNYAHDFRNYAHKMT